MLGCFDQHHQATGAGLICIRQRYERRNESGWWYESPDAGYAALLQVNPDGFVVDYPGLWRGADSFRK